MKSIKIGKNKIGINYRPYIIVEACVNHQGNFQIAKKMIYFAKNLVQCIDFNIILSLKKCWRKIFQNHQILKNLIKSY